MSRGYLRPSSAKSKKRMELPFDIIYTIGLHCDPKTRVSLCLASKDFYLCDADWLHFQKMKSFGSKCMEIIREVQAKETKAARVKGVHKIFRFLVEHKEYLKHPMFTRFITILKPKLEEFGENGMCKRKAKKYMVELGL